MVARFPSGQAELSARRPAARRGPPPILIALAAIAMAFACRWAEVAPAGAGGAASGAAGRPAAIDRNGLAETAAAAEAGERSAPRRRTAASPEARWPTPLAGPAPAPAPAALRDAAALPCADASRCAAPAGRAQAPPGSIGHRGQRTPTGPPAA
jgi:hypothetical protein